MPLVIGMDEAGYGPNLGPLVVTATLWQVSAPPRHVDFWKAFEGAVSQTVPHDRSQLHIADSKVVYSVARGVGNLEAGVLGTFELCGGIPRSFRELCEKVCPSVAADMLDAEPWFRDRNIPLPCAAADGCWHDAGRRWMRACEQHGIRLRAIASDIVPPSRFNRLTRQYDNKGLALSRITLALLRSVWRPDGDEPAFIVADKHGGRNRYDGLLSEIADGTMIFRVEEGADLSRYRVGTTEIRFQTRAEAHLPVAVASMVSKYVRELAMLLFNRFWCDQLPDLIETRGYPTDAVRFRRDIAALQQQLGITDDVLWRER